MANDSGSKSGRCGCGSDSNAKKDSGPCPSSGSEKKSGFSKTPCKKNSSGKGKCHESHEQFKQQSKPVVDKCKSAGDSSREQCSTAYQEFTRAVSGENPCGGSSKNECECQESSTQCSERKTSDCSNSHEYESEREQQCNKSIQKSVPCSAQTKHDPCSGSLDKTTNMSTNNKRDCKSHADMDPCSGSVGTRKKTESPCGSKREDDSLYSKITSKCKDMAKDFVKPRSKTKCGVDESLKDSICNNHTPQPSLPCPPKTEKGVGYTPACCTSSATCPERKVSTWADFFPLDARNKKLNDCIEKYSKCDPSQVVKQCSQFANKTMDTSESCVQQVRESQQQCRKGVSGVRSSEPTRSLTPLISPHNRMLLSRWAPSAALYLATSGLIMLYLTEWKAVPGVYPDFTDKTDKE